MYSFTVIVAAATAERQQPRPLTNVAVNHSLHITLFCANGKSTTRRRMNV